MERLQTLIKENGISKYRLAKDLHIAESTVRSWIKGISNPREQQMNKLAAYFRVPAAWIRYGDPHYAPSYIDDVQRISEKLEQFGRANPEKLKHKIKLFEMLLEEDQFSKEHITIYPKAKRTRRKSAA